jgi:hypothetical protein
MKKRRPTMGDLIESNIEHETYREYEWSCPATGERHVYRIDQPRTLYVRPGGSTHRVVDAEGVAHCVPAVGQLGCALRWKNPEGVAPVNF